MLVHQGVFAFELWTVNKPRLPS
ncbi:MAG UNVERIFIED_CONTAM: hypothetical protein LVT10_09120 [Anaerolineae bacterium]